MAAVTVGLWVFVNDLQPLQSLYSIIPNSAGERGQNVRLLCSQGLWLTPSAALSLLHVCTSNTFQLTSAPLESASSLRGWSPLVERNIEDLRPDYCKCLILLRWHCSQPLSVGTGRKEHTHTHTGFKWWVYIIRIQNPFLDFIYVYLFSYNETVQI